MDIVHHGIIGVIGVNSSEDLKLGMAGIFFLIGSLFPDLDVILMLFGKRFYLKNHQGVSHSLILLPIFSFLILTLFISLIPFSWINFFALSLGILIHTLLDYSNTYGIKLFYPVSKKRFSLDAIFFIDTFLITLSISILIFHYNILIYITLFISYLIFKTILQKSVIKKLNCDFAIPSALNPFEFYIYKSNQKEIITYQYNFLTKKIFDYRVEKNRDREYSHLTEKSQLFKDIEEITKALHITDVFKTSNSIVIKLKDLALRNFGGKFATTTLIFNKKGELLYEISNI